MLKLKTIKIDKTNIEDFAEELNKFDDHYQSEARRAYKVEVELLQALDHAGFDMTHIKGFRQWDIDDLVSPRQENPVLYFKSWFWECYFDYYNITKYYAHNMGNRIYGNYVKLSN